MRRFNSSGLARPLALMLMLSVSSVLTLLVGVFCAVKMEPTGIADAGYAAVSQAVAEQTAADPTTAWTAASTVDITRADAPVQMIALAGLVALINTALALALVGPPAGGASLAERVTEDRFDDAAPISAGHGNPVSEAGRLRDGLPRAQRQLAGHAGAATLPLAADHREGVVGQGDGARPGAHDAIATASGALVETT